MRKKGVKINDLLLSYFNKYKNNIEDIVRNVRQMRISKFSLVYIFYFLI